ncbi:MAG: hypothetical protein AB7P02_27885 [Alphaproteobacteria bacterium]
MTHKDFRDAGPSDGAAVDRERRDIDTGATADKVKALDPAAAPLGTDEEAAGHAAVPARDAVRTAAEPGGIRAGPQPSGNEWWIAIPVVAVAAIAAAVLLLAV